MGTGLVQLLYKRPLLQGASSLRNNAEQSAYGLVQALLVGRTNCTEVTKEVTVTVATGRPVADQEGAVLKVLEGVSTAGFVGVTSEESPGCNANIPLNCSGMDALFRDWSCSYFASCLSDQAHPRPCRSYTFPACRSASRGQRRRR
jgi:hypothetical protein